MKCPKHPDYEFDDCEPCEAAAKRRAIEKVAMRRPLPAAPPSAGETNHGR